MQTSSYAYDALPVHWQSDVDFLRALPGYPRKHVLGSCPELSRTSPRPGGLAEINRRCLDYHSSHRLSAANHVK